MKGATNMLSTIILGLFCYSFVAGIFDDVWYSKLRYSTQYNVEFSEITKQESLRIARLSLRPSATRDVISNGKFGRSPLDSDEATRRPIYFQ